MKVILDTNVLISGIFFGGPPRAVIEAWVSGRYATLVPDVPGSDPISADPDDDKFMLCAYGNGATVVSGDKHLRDVDGWRGVPVVKPRDFLESLPGGTPDSG